MVCDSFAALSQYLARMREDGLVTYRREAQTLLYRIDNHDVEKVIATLKAIFCPTTENEAEEK